MSNFPATQPTLVMPFSGMDTPTRMQQLLDSWGATFTRATTATYINKLGLVESVASGLPRPNFDSVTKENKGILIEEARTNLLERSEEFDNAYWSKTNVSVSANDTLSPDGVNSDADKITATTTTASSQTYVSRSGIATSAVCTFSIFAKKDTVDYLILRINDSNGIIRAFDLENGTIGSTTYTGTTNATIEQYPNGWYRCSVTSTGTLDGSVELLAYISSNGNANYTPTLTDAIFLWGAQLEEASFPTSYIPTTSATVTRNADQLKIGGTAFSDFYNAQHSTLLVEGTTGFEPSSFRTFAFSDGTNANRIVGTGLSSGNLGLFVQDSSSTQVNTAVAVTSPFKVAYCISNNAYYMYANGSQVIEDTTGTVPTVDRLVIGGFANESASGLIQLSKIAYYPVNRDTFGNAQLQKLTRST